VNIVISMVFGKHKGGDHMASWKCGNCGYMLEADTPPEKCPSCKKKCEFLDNTCYTPDCEIEGIDKRI
jgi:rubredoxin